MENIKEPILTENAAESIRQVFGDFDFNSSIQSIVDGKFSPDTGSLINRIAGLFFGELKASASMIGVIASLVIVCAIVNNLQGSFGKKGVSTATHFACFVYLATITVASFEKVSAYVLGILHDISVLMQSIVPAMAMLYISGGGVVGSFSHPVVFFVCSAFSSLIKNVITPLCLLRGATSLLCGISQSAVMNEFSEIFSKLHKTLLALSMTFFVGILGVSHFASNSFDNLAARGLRFVVTTAVPVVGGSISEAMSSVMQSALLLKNAVGITAVIMLFAMFVVPMIKIWVVSMLFRITAAIAAPVSQNNVSTVLKKTSECIDMLFSSVACMGVTMVIAIASLM